MSGRVAGDGSKCRRYELKNNYFSLSADKEKLNDTEQTEQTKQGSNNTELKTSTIQTELMKQQRTGASVITLWLCPFVRAAPDLKSLLHKMCNLSLNL